MGKSFWKRNFFVVRFCGKEIVKFEDKKKSNAMDSAISFATQLHKVSNVPHEISVYSMESDTELLFLERV